MLLNPVRMRDRFGKTQAKPIGDCGLGGWWELVAGDEGGGRGGGEQIHVGESSFWEHASS